MASSASTVTIAGLGKEKLAALRAQAKRLGMTAERYARELVEDGMDPDRKARATTFDELFAPVRARFRQSGMSEQDLDVLVDKARARHHRRTSRTVDQGEKVGCSSRAPALTRNH